MVLLVELDLFRLAVFLRVGVGHGMSVVAVGVDFEDGGPALFVGALDGVPSFGPDFIEVLTIDDVPIDVVALGAFGQTGFARGGTG